jgi:hypothetical protein
MGYRTNSEEADVLSQPPYRTEEDTGRLSNSKRQLLEELAEVKTQSRQLSREIETKAIPIPWLT